MTRSFGNHGEGDTLRDNFRSETMDAKVAMYPVLSLLSKLPIMLISAMFRWDRSGNSGV